MALGKQPLPRDAEPPYLDLIRDDPINFAPRYDLTRARIAYGRLGLPILMRDLEGTDTNKQHFAINSLTDLFHDTEILYNAVEQKIIERIHQLLGSSEVDVEDAALNALSIACTHYVGSNAVIISEAKSKCLEKSTPIDEVEMGKACDSDIPVLGRLASMLSSKVYLLRYKAAHVVRNISHCWDGKSFL
ncbi:hypothetical protein J437_LFUL014105 [Ladona fulva]|uniref:Uncharacterized protein n=1 Tax=Ladona fulva TaxID=123851 RepID=A0A8K0KF13_LADFU|nr:hypothetical protein J437_LFUL014105 [Ladona fulva]